MSEQIDILDRVAAGDQRAWASLVREHSPMLRSIAYQFRLPAGEAEDAQQLTWMSLFQHVRQVRSACRVRAWLATTMKRNCLQLHRRRRHEQPWDDCSAGTATDANVERVVLLAERDRTLWQIVDRLPDQHRRLIRALFADVEPSYDSIASDLSMAIGSIGPTRKRALHRLRTLVGQAGIHRGDIEAAA